MAAGRGLIDKDPPAIPVTAPVREPAHLTSDVSTGTACSHPHHTHTNRHTHRERTDKTFGLPLLSFLNGAQHPLKKCFLFVLNITDLAILLLQHTNEPMGIIIIM